MTYTVDELISLVKLYAAVPAQQPSFNNTNLLRIINNEYNNIIVPKIMGMNSEYFVSYSDTTISADGTSPSPNKAIGAVLGEWKIINGDVITNVPLLDIDTMENNNAFGFIVRDNTLYLQCDEDFVGQTLRMYYYRRRNELVLAARAALISTVGTTN
jgi:hypothetical protein